MPEPTVVRELVTNFAVAAAILILGLWLAKRLKNLMSKVMIKRGVDAMLASFMSSIAYILAAAFIVIAALGHLGIQTTSLVAIIGAAGLAIGLALQGSLANFASGVMIIAFRPFKVGDFVEAGGAVGVVEGIQIFSTQMKTGDNKTIIIPNANITNSNITNYSTKDTRRVDLVFGIGYDDDIKKAKQILEDIVTNDERILKDPAPVVAVSELADSSVNFIVRPWVNAADYWAVYWDLTETVKLVFDKEGISIPYPQQDVHMHQAA
ncbi:MAG: mechanosensitive ion channel [Gammaproteobacteria bacterium]|jgi:small conductance mechanosensitive channel|nr:mechanosensitive ion channel [Gammaproteobacteria bacterium]